MNTTHAVQAHSQLLRQAADHYAKLASELDAARRQRDRLLLTMRGITASDLKSSKFAVRVMSEARDAVEAVERMMDDPNKIGTFGDMARKGEIAGDLRPASTGRLGPPFEKATAFIKTAREG